MVKHWLIYIALLIGTVVFFLFYQMWLAWYCMILLLLLLPIALLLAFVMSRNGRVSMVSPKNPKIGDKANMKVRMNAGRIASFSIARVDLSVEEKMTGIKSKKYLFLQGRSEVAIPMDTRHCGAFRYNVERVRIYDPLGLFWFRKKAKCSCEVVVHPVPQMPEMMPTLNGFKARTLRRSSSTYSEIYDVREYVMGDPIKNIHWKASATKDAIMVKEPQEECYGHARVFLQLAEDRDTFDKKMGEVLFTSNYFLSRDIPHRIRVLPPKKREVGFDIQSQRDLDTAILRILHMKIPKELLDEKKN